MCRIQSNFKYLHLSYVPTELGTAAFFDLQVMTPSQRNQRLDTTKRSKDRERKAVTMIRFTTNFERVKNYEYFID